jgi:DNA-binding SARP family transcriptional activator
MPTAPPAPLQPPCLRLLGGFQLLDAQGQVLTLPYDKARALLALLCLHSGALEREPLAQLLWPDSEPAQARANLRRALYDLRRCLARLWPQAQIEPLLGDKKQVQLSDGLPWQIDCREFSLAQLDAATPAPEARRAALQRAVALYRGPLLAGLGLDDAPGFESWLAPRREALQRQALQSLNELGELLEQQGEHAQALDCARRSLALDPWCEQALRRSLRLQAQSPAQALALFEQFSQRLHAELGLAPQPETLALAQRLRQPAPVATPGSVQRRRVVALACEWEVPAEDAQDTDAELLAALLLQRLEQARGQLQAQGAWVQRAEGGELLAFFGHPRALEQAPRLALDAALALLQAGGGRDGLAPRLGLHVGWVHSLPEQASPDSIGTLSREARRLAWLAQPGTARISAALRQLSLHHHRFHPGAADGSAELQAAIGPQAPPAALQPMVGRADELAALLDHWAQARQGSRAIWIEAEPGLGKTRLLHALREALATREGGALRQRQLACQPEFSHSPWHPVVAALQRGLGLLSQLSPSVPDPASPHAALRALLRRAGLDPQTDLAPLAQLLPAPTALPQAGQPDASGLNKRALQQLLIALFEGLGQGRPQLVCVEDLHWADPSTLDLLALYLQRPPAQRSPGLIVLSSREPPPAALAGALQAHLRLAPLAEPEMLQLIEQLALAPESTAARQQVLQRAQGVPLFAQELARSLRLSPQERVPATLWDLLAARLDRLPAGARRLAQCAAVLGSDGDTSLLQAMQDGPAAQVATQLAAELALLAREGLLQTEGHGHWQFRHALIRDAAYESLAARERRALHRRAAEALMGPFACRAADEPELLAQHLQASGDAAAAHYWLQAGRRAAGQSAHVEARHLLEQGLQALAHADAAPALLQRLQPPLLLQLGNSLLALEGYGSRAARRCFEQALDASGTGAASELRFQALWGLWLGSRSSADEQAGALQLAEQLGQQAQRSGDAAAAVQAGYALGNNLFFLGRLQASAQALRAAAEAGERLPAGSLLARYGEHGGIAARAMLSWPLALQGQAEEAQAQARQALQQARALGQAQTLGFALTMGAVMHRHMRQPAQALPLCQELLALADKHDLALWRAVGALVLGWVRAQQGEPEGLSLIEQAVAASAVAMPSTEPTFLSFLIEAQLRLGLHEAALARADEALAKAPERQELYLLPELWRMRAQAAQACGADAATVDKLLDQALAAARQMGAELLWQRCMAQRSAPVHTQTPGIQR